MSTREDPNAKHRLPREPKARLKVAICLASAVLVAAGVAVYGMSERRPEETSPPLSAMTVPIVRPPSLEAVPQPLDVPLSPPAIDTLEASFADLSDEVGADIGLAYAPLNDPGQVNHLGNWSNGPAWSTIKVPLSLALLRETGGAATSAMRSAITISDNAAAQSIWDDLGGGEVAAGKVEGVLTAAGNSGTDVPSELRRAGFSIFGQTDWSLIDQAGFLARVACDPAAAPVTDLMGEITSGQQWGLGAIDGAHFKGGWGPGTDGLYLVRQFGVVPTPSGRVAVAIAAVADTGGFADGTAVLNRVAEWLQNHLGEVGGGQCPPV